MRFPEGGGVVTVAAHAFNPWFGALGGMLILVDYFLTSALSSLSGVLYLDTIIPATVSNGLLTLETVLPTITVFTLGMFLARALWTFLRKPGWMSSIGLVVATLALVGFGANLVAGSGVIPFTRIEITRVQTFWVMIIPLATFALLGVASIVYFKYVTSAHDNRPRPDGEDTATPRPSEF